MQTVLSYWLTPQPTTAEEASARLRFWFEGGKAVDEEIRARFGALVGRACAGELDAWTETPHGSLALIVLLDQFTRNVYRGTAQAFAADAKALALAGAGYESGKFADLDPLERMFAAMPFRHAEDVEAQKRGVALAVGDALRGPPHLKDLLVFSVDWARKHLDVVVRFGRFPHRNPVLGRRSTPEEIEYLDYLKAAGQWL